MSIFTSLGIIIFSMLIIASLKLIPGVFALFYHHASGKYSSKKVSDLTIFFILGVETLSALIIILVNLLTNLFFFTNLTPESKILSWTLSGISFAAAFSFFFFYFRRSRGTELFISRKTAANFITKTKNIKTRSDAFVLGLVSGAPELIFTLPLYIISILQASNLAPLPISCSEILIFFVILTTTPLFFLYAYFKLGNNLASFEKHRVKNKNFFRIFITILYLLIAVSLIIFEAIS